MAEDAAASPAANNDTSGKTDASSQARIEVCEHVDAEVVAAYQRLHPQLSGSPTPSGADLKRIVSHAANTVLLARASHGDIVGTMVLVVFPLPSGRRAWIEDVVVAESERGRGIGAALIRRAVGIARDAGARTVDLTSRPDRAAANRLYARLGFEQRATNVYRLSL